MFAIVLEVDDQSFNVTRAVHYLDRLVGTEHQLAGTTPASLSSRIQCTDCDSLSLSLSLWLS